MHPVIPNKPSHELRRLLENAHDRGFTQAELAEVLGTTQQTVSRWISGQSAPPRSKVVAYLDRLAEFVENEPTGVLPPDDSLDAWLAFYLDSEHEKAFDLPPLPVSRHYWSKEERNLIENRLVPRRHGAVWVPIPPGHGATSLARTVEHERAEKLRDSQIAVVRVSIETAVADALGIDETDVYERLLEESQVDTLRHTLENFDFRAWVVGRTLQSLGLAMSAGVLDVVETEKGEAFRLAVEADDPGRALAAGAVELAVIFDVSTSRLGQRPDGSSAEWVDAVAQKMLINTAEVLFAYTDPPSAAIFVGDADPVELESQARGLLNLNAEVVTEDVPILRRSRDHLFRFIAIQLGADYEEFRSRVDSRLTPENIKSRPVMISAAETRENIRRALAVHEDPAGVLRATDDKRAALFNHRRLELLEAEHSALKERMTAVEDRLDKLDSNRFLTRDIHTTLANG